MSLIGSRIDNGLFILALLFAVGLIWQTPYLPMLDLPQHVGQIAVLHDMLFATHPFADELRLNFFTPYLLFYLPAVALSTLTTPLIACKILLTLSLLGFVGAGWRLLRYYGAEPFLLWLFLPAFFGLSFLGGFLTFLLAAPLVLLSLELADRYSHTPTARRAAGLITVLIALFFCHGLAFYFAFLLTGLLWLSYQWRQPITLIKGGLPLLLAAVPGIIHLYVSLVAAPTLAAPEPVIFYPIAKRLSRYLQFQAAMPDRWTVSLTGVLLLTPFLFTTARQAARGAYVLLAGLFCLWLTLPYNLAGVAFVFDRFSLYLLPFLAFALRPRLTASLIQKLARGLMVLVVFALFAHQALYQAEFAAREAPYLAALNQLPPQKRLLNLSEPELLLNLESLPTWHLASWYQSERQGWTEFNFANFIPQIVRYRDPAPAIYFTRQTQLNKFDWTTYQTDRFDFISVRHHKPLSPHLFAAARCGVTLWQQGEHWSIYRVNKTCA
jgi:hypothetical protein